MTNSQQITNDPFYFNNHYYGNKASLYNGLKQWARMIYPPTFKFETTSDKVSNILLDIMCGLPVGKGAQLRIFYKAAACNLLAQHLQGNIVNLNDALKLRLNYRQVYPYLSTLRLTA